MGRERKIMSVHTKYHSWHYWTSHKFTMLSTKQTISHVFRSILLGTKFIQTIYATSPPKQQYNVQDITLQHGPRTPNKVHCYHTNPNNCPPGPSTPTSDDGVDALIQQRHGWGAAEGNTIIRRENREALIYFKQIISLRI